MKSIEKLQEAYSLLHDEFENSKNDIVGEAIIKIHEFIIDNNPVKKSGLSVWEFVSDDKLRPAMMNVFHDNDWKAAVSTDAHVLFVNPAEYVDCSVKPDGCVQKFDYEKYTGLIIDKYGKPTDDFTYPNFRAVMLKDGVDFEIRQDLAQVRDIFKSTVKLRGLGSKKKWSNGAICLNKELNIWVSDRYVDLILRAGVDGWKCSKENPDKRAIQKDFDDGKILLIMPMMPPEKDKEGYDASNMCWYIC